MIEFLEVRKLAYLFHWFSLHQEQNLAKKGHNKYLINEYVPEASTFREEQHFLGISGFHSLWLCPTLTP